MIVVEPTPSAALIELHARFMSIALVRRPFRGGDCEGAMLVFACTDQADVQSRVAADARSAGALLCRADDGDDGDFMSAAVLRRQELCVAVSCGGASPVLGAHVRDIIAAAIGDEYGEAVRRLAAVRSRLRLSYATPSERAAAVRRLLDAGWIRLLGRGAEDEADTLLASLLGEVTVAEAAHEVDPCIRIP